MGNLGQSEEKRVKKNLYSVAYWSTHKDEIACKRNVKVLCACGLEVSKRHLEEHQRSRNHTNALKTRSQELTDILMEKTNADIAQHIMSFV